MWTTGLGGSSAAAKRVSVLPVSQQSLVSQPRTVHFEEEGFFRKTSPLCRRQRRLGFRGHIWALGVLDGGVQRIGGQGMDRSSSRVGKGTAGSSSSARAEMEEAMGKLDIAEEEATPFVIDVPITAKPKWLVAGEDLVRKLVPHTGNLQRPPPGLGNPRGLVIRPLGANMFVAEFESQRDRDRVWEGSPWHVSKHAVILEQFEECMRPSELKFDKLEMWVRGINLP